jgi:PAS domain-containing protein
VQTTLTFLKRYLLQQGLLIILITVTVLLALNTTLIPLTWKSYVLFALLIMLAALLFNQTRRLFTDEAMRRAAGERLEEADEKYRSLLETSADGTLLIHAPQRIGSFCSAPSSGGAVGSC